MKKMRRIALYGSKNLSALLKETTLKHDGGFYCLNCLHSSRTKTKLESHEKLCENIFNVLMPSEDTKILKFNQN